MTSPVYVPGKMAVWTWAKAAKTNPMARYRSPINPSRRCSRRERPAAQRNSEAARTWATAPSGINADGNGAAAGVPGARTGKPMDASGGNRSAPTSTSAIASTIVTADPSTMAGP